MSGLMIARHVEASIVRSVVLRTAAMATVTGGTLAVLAPAPGLAALIAAGAVALTAGVILPVLGRTNGEVLHCVETLLKGNIEALEVLGGSVARREHGGTADNARLVLYAVAIAERAKLPEHEIRALIKGALVHDIGNVMLPDIVLLKPGPLDGIEFEAVKTHVFHGAELVSRSSWLKDAAQVVRSHHEKWDGSGYPDGLRGTAIPVAARVFAVADVFDALTSERPYRGRLSFEKALDIMLKGRGGHFDPELYDIFATLAPSVYAEVSGKSEDDIAHDLLLIAFRYFRQPGQRR